MNQSDSRVTVNRFEYILRSGLMYGGSRTNAEVAEDTP